MEKLSDFSWALWRTRLSQSCLNIYRLSVWWFHNSQRASKHCTTECVTQNGSAIPTSIVDFPSIILQYFLHITVFRYSGIMMTKHLINRPDLMRIQLNITPTDLSIITKRSMTGNISAVLVITGKDLMREDVMRKGLCYKETWYNVVEMNAIPSSCIVFSK